MTDDKVVPLFGAKAEPERPVGYWTCNACGCLTHYIRSDSEVECAHCARLTHPHDDRWRTRIAAHTPEDVPEAEPGSTIVVDLDTPTDMSFVRMRKDLVREGTVFVLIARDDGSMTSWSCEKEFTGDRLAWVDRKLKQFREVITLQAPSSD